MVQMYPHFYKQTLLDSLFVNAASDHIKGDRSSGKERWWKMTLSFGISRPSHWGGRFVIA